MPQLARQAIRFALGEGVTSVLAPPDAQLLAMAIDCVGDLVSLPDEKRQACWRPPRGWNRFSPTVPRENIVTDPNAQALQQGLDKPADSPK